MYERNTVLNIVHHLFIAGVFCRAKQHSLSPGFIHSLYIFKASTMKWPCGVNPLPNKSTAMSKTALFPGNPCSDAERCLCPLFSPLGDGPFVAGMGWVGIRHNYGLYRVCSKARELQILTVQLSIF